MEYIIVFCWMERWDFKAHLFTQELNFKDLLKCLSVEWGCKDEGLKEEIQTGNHQIESIW